MRAMVDADLCTACGLCADAVPGVFRLDDSVAEVVMDTIPEDLEDDVRDAALDCPASAIAVIET
jgi:ferredoxin